MRTHPLSLLTACAVAAAVPAAAHAQAPTPPPPADPAPGLTRIADYDGNDVSVLRETAVWSREDADGYHLVRSVAGGAPTDVPNAVQPFPWDIDLGTGSNGGLAAVASVCKPGGTYGGEKRGSCDVVRVDLTSGKLTLVRQASEPGVDEVDPAIWAGTIAFGREGQGKASVRIAGPKAKRARAIVFGKRAQAFQSIDAVDLDAGGLAVSGSVAQRDLPGAEQLWLKPANKPARQVAQWGFGEEHAPFFSVSLSGPTLWAGVVNEADSGSPTSAVVAVNRKTGAARGQDVQRSLDAVAADAATPGGPLWLTTAYNEEQPGSASQVARLDAPALGPLTGELKRIFRLR